MVCIYAMAYICVTKAKNMTLKQIAAKINENETWLGYNMNCEVAKAWEVPGKSRIYIGREYIEVVNGLAKTPAFTTRKGFYESNDSFSVRSEQLAKISSPIDVVVRYVNILLKK